MIKTISHAELLLLVNYDPETGTITRKVRTSNRVKVGDLVGFPDANGYLQANIGGVRAYVHQFAWLYVHGVWPHHDIDHKDRNTQNNRILNLRRATGSQNIANSGLRKNNTSGFKGVHPKGEKWCSQIRCRGNVTTLGLFDTPQEAHAAYSAAATRLFGEFARAA
ncbi:hypothetical protein ABIB94_007091 [Bradyrhizobium sp. JR7.2]|uniref:HNH endonuclease n=1 Tax=Bradyrhizobium sp. JR7.2 TaxID=3156375 RepID=UPI0033987861